MTVEFEMEIDIEYRDLARALAEALKDNERLRAALRTVRLYLDSEPLGNVVVVTPDEVLSDKDLSKNPSLIQFVDAVLGSGLEQEAMKLEG